MPDLDTIDRSLQTTHLWLHDIMDDLGVQDRQRAWHALRAVLAAYRDRLPVAEAAHLSAQLPLLVRGLFWDGWDPGHQSRARTRAEFLELVQRHLDPRPPMDPEDCFRAVTRTLWKHVTRGELDDVRSVLPQEVQQMIDRVVKVAVS